MKYIGALTILLFSCIAEGAATPRLLMIPSRIQELYKVPLDLATCSVEQRDGILAAAAQMGNLPKVEAAIGAGADPQGAPGYASPLMHAIHGGHNDVVSFLLIHGALVNRLEWGISPFHLAIRRGNIPIIKTCLAYGANPFIKTVECLDAFDEALMRHFHDSETLFCIIDLLKKTKI